ncbi:MAG TPA: hypothetical protein VHW09_06455 [Bryobacteraceae bacterium]|jgi:photosystem II stability/assembly factor-like uncharacterized protein|nr:hypothetical protein [Bryobacteraceae bacterium]
MKRIAIVLPLLAVSLCAQQFNEDLLKHFTWRSVGPAGAGGRVVDISVSGDPARVYIATGGGGVWKTTSWGTTWEPIFEHEDVGAIGAVAADPSNPDTVWVGTGEANPRNSVSWGDGVYKSTDGGKTWKRMGLPDSQHIGRIRIDPRNPDVVYVAALGHIWGPNKERGVYKTTDGGLTWTQSLAINPDTGVVDLAMDPGDPNTLYAAAYEVRRDGFAGGDPGKQWGPGSGIYKTSDGGRTWRKLSQGLPRGDLGRIGLAVAPSNPGIVYAVVQTPTTAPVTTGEENGPPPPPTGPRTMRDGGVFRSDDRGETWHWVNSVDNRPFYYSQVRVDPTNENHLFVLGSNNSESDDGGVTFRNVTENIHVDHHAMWIDPRNPRHIIDGNDGGLYMTWDGGHTWDFQNQMALSQMYSVDVDMRRPYYIYGGSQDYCSWEGPSATRNQVGIKYADWFKVQTGDGFQVRVDPTDYNIVYAESQNGGVVRYDLHSGRDTSIKPTPRSGQPPYRFNWETPLTISAHDPKMLYMGGNFVFKSTDRGDSWTVISPELTTEKVGTITMIAESPVNPAVLYAGTDDGNVWATRDGKNWKNITSDVPGMPGKRWVSRLLASRYDAGTVFLAFDGHRSDDFTTYLFKSTDYGATWKSIKSDLPPATPVRVIREDVKNANLLFAGTESAAYASLDGGGHWVRLMNRLPTTPVADLIVHPRDGDLIAATHGRSFWVMDISPLEELTPEVLASDAHLFTVKPAIAFDYRVFTNDEFLAEKRFIGENPPMGTAVSYYLKSGGGDIKLAILDKSGAVVRDLTATKEKGINRVQWDLRGKPLVQPGRGGRGGRGGGGGRGGAAAADAEVPAGRGGGGRGGASAALVDPGDYVARLTVDGKEFTTPVHVDADPDVNASSDDIRTRRTVITAAIALQAKTEPANAKVDSLDTQLEALSKDVPDAPSPIKEALAKALKESNTLKTEMARINRGVTQLFGQVSGSPFLPTVTQRDDLADLEKDFGKQSAALDALLKTTVPGIEKQLNQANVPRISVK